MPINKPALAGRLAAYLAERARREGVPMRLTPADFEDALDQGIGSAFGVHWDAHGNLTRDDEEPEPGFLFTWIGCELAGEAPTAAVGSGERHPGRPLGPS